MTETFTLQLAGALISSAAKVAWVCILLGYLGILGDLLHDAYVERRHPVRPIKPARLEPMTPPEPSESLDL